MKNTRLWLALSAAAALQAYVLYYMLHYDSLLGLVPWDDCAILLRGLQNINRFAQAHTVLGLGIAAARIDIHAALSDIQTLLGLLLTGGQSWGPYALGIGYIFIVIAALHRTAALKNSWFFFAAMVFMLLQPITLRALGEVKSDWLAGIYLAAAMFVLFDAAEEDDDKSQWVGAGLLSLALLSKLTAVYMPVVMLAVFLGFDVYRALRHAHFAVKSRTRPAGATEWTLAYLQGLRHRLLHVAIILVPFLLFFLHNAKSLINYIRESTGPIWRDHYTTMQRLLFYLPVDGQGAITWGWLHVAFILFGLAATVTAAMRRAWLHMLVIAGVVALPLLLLAPLTLVGTSGITFGAPFFGAVVGASLVCMRIFTINAPKTASVAAPLLLIAVILPATLPLGAARDVGFSHLTTEQRLYYKSIYEDMAGRIAVTATKATPSAVFMFDYRPAPYPNLALLYFEHTRRLMAVDRVDDLADPRVPKALQGADFVVTATPNDMKRGMGDMSVKFAASRDLTAGDALVRNSAYFAEVTTYPVPEGEIRLYRAIPRAADHPAGLQPR